MSHDASRIAATAGRDGRASFNLTEQSIVAALYYYRVAYLFAGKRGVQRIHSQNPEANLALAQESARLLAEILAGPDVPSGSQVEVVGIQGITDGKQSWPPVAITTLDQSASSGPAIPAAGLEGLNFGPKVALNLSPVDALTANGLPTPEAAGKYKLEELQGLAAQLAMGDVSAMKFPELRKNVLAKLAESLKAAA